MAGDRAIDINELRALAEAAPSGKRRASSHGLMSDGRPNPDWFVSGLRNTAAFLSENEAKLIAALDRDAVLFVLDELEQARKDLAAERVRSKAERESMLVDIQVLQRRRPDAAEMARLDAEVARLRSDLERAKACPCVIAREMLEPVNG